MAALRHNAEALVARAVELQLKEAAIRTLTDTLQEKDILLEV